MGSGAGVGSTMLACRSGSGSTSGAERLGVRRRQGSRSFRHKGQELRCRLGRVDLSAAARQQQAGQGQNDKQCRSAKTQREEQVHLAGLRSQGFRWRRPGFASSGRHKVADTNTGGGSEWQLDMGPLREEKKGCLNASTVTRQSGKGKKIISSL